MDRNEAQMCIRAVETRGDSANLSNEQGEAILRAIGQKAKNMSNTELIRELGNIAR